MLSEIAYFPILGKPWVLYMGVTTPLLLFIITASMGLMIFRGVKIPFKFHPHDGRDLNYRRDCPWYFRGGVHG